MSVSVWAQVDKLESECSQLQQELQDSKDQNELLEFRILELEVSQQESRSAPLAKEKSHHVVRV